MLLAGGPDRERPVSLMSAAEVGRALAAAGHDVRQCDIGPDNTAALDQFTDWAGDVVFPVLHGPWGEGGPLQALLDERGLPYVGSDSAAAQRCIDKHQTKQVLDAHDLPTPEYELVERGKDPALAPPVVVKALCEGSSFELEICHGAAQFTTALEQLLSRHEKVIVERFIGGRELTVGVLGDRSLPVLEVAPATDYYDYEAKYTRTDTQYLFDIDLPGSVLDQVADQALRAHRALGCRHLSRVDFMIDAQHRPWILEINTMPGFTSHSLLPMAAHQVGLDLPALVDRLARWGAGLSDE